MDSKERVAHILNHEEADRVPIDFWAVDEVWGRLMEYFGFGSHEALLRHLRVDCHWPEICFADLLPVRKR